ncbi:MAG: hypothetical protein WCP55_07115 [Lentisphaerota bacterium]
MEIGKPMKKSCIFIIMTMGIALFSKDLDTKSFYAEKTDKSVLLGNSYFTVEIFPEVSGGCGRITVSGQDYFAPEIKMNCLFSEVFSSEAMEKKQISESKPFQYSVSKNASDESVTLKMWRKVEKDKLEQDFAGTGFEKTVTICRDKPYLSMISTVDNSSGKALYLNFGFKNHLRMNKAGKDLYFLPTSNNIQCVAKTLVNGYYGKSSAWEYEPVESWMAVLDPDTKNALVFIMEDKYLEAFYTAPSGDSFGWFLNGDELAPQKQFKTECKVVPVSGFDGFVHASSRIIADIQVREDKDDIAVKHTVFGLEKLSSVILRTEVYSIRSKKTQSLPEVKFENAGCKISSQTLTLPGKQTEPLVVRVSVNLDGVTEQYETYYEGRFPASIYPGYPLSSEYKRKKTDTK